MPGTEQHPLEPFIPYGARILMLGSFPPGKQRWSMEFFYPNFQNDMWRIMGLIFFDNKHHFVQESTKSFDKTQIVEFCTQKGIALYDTACVVRRLKDNASDKFLEIVQATDIAAMIKLMPQCKVIAATGQKALETIAQSIVMEMPQMGQYTQTDLGKIYRMPSSSRAYPLSVEKKAEIYRGMFAENGLL